jgi:hypothetical protein
MSAVRRHSPKSCPRRAAIQSAAEGVRFISPMKNQRASRWFPRRGETSRDDVLKQDRIAWSFEVEARPFKEKW